MTITDDIMRAAEAALQPSRRRIFRGDAIAVKAVPIEDVLAFLESKTRCCANTWQLPKGSHRWSVRNATGQPTS